MIDYLCVCVCLWTGRFDAFDTIQDDAFLVNSFPSQFLECLFKWWNDYKLIISNTVLVHINRSKYGWWRSKVIEWSAQNKYINNWPQSRVWVHKFIEEMIKCNCHYLKQWIASEMKEQQRWVINSRSIPHLLDSMWTVWSLLTNIWWDTFVTVFIIQGCNMGEAGCRALAEMLMVNTTLTNLNTKGLEKKNWWNLLFFHKSILLLTGNPFGKFGQGGLIMIAKGREGLRLKF